MRIIDLASKDLSQMLRDRRSLMFLVAMPIVFTIFMGFAYRGGSSSAPQDNRLSLAWVDGEPGGKLSAMLFDRLSASDALKPLPMDEAAALKAAGVPQRPQVQAMPSLVIEGKAMPS